jgi:hypothetical protein
MSMLLSSQGGRGSKIVQKKFHVLLEWPLDNYSTANILSNSLTKFKKISFEKPHLIIIQDFRAD